MKCRFLGLWLTVLCLRAEAVRPLQSLLGSFLQQPPAFRAKDAFIAEAVFLDQHLVHATVIGRADQFLLKPVPQIVNREQIVAQPCISVMTLFCRQALDAEFFAPLSTVGFFFLGTRPPPSGDDLSSERRKSQITFCKRYGCKRVHAETESVSECTRGRLYQYCLLYTSDADDE